MNEHDKIRELLALAAADALTSAEEKQVAEHVRSCIACSNELEAWRPIASELRRLPTPQPSSWLVQATLARAEAKLTEQAEHDWNRRVMIVVRGVCVAADDCELAGFPLCERTFREVARAAVQPYTFQPIEHGSVLPRSPP